MATADRAARDAAAKRKKDAARKAAAKKRATSRAQGRTRQQIMTPGKVVESGLGGYAAAKAGQAVAKKVAKMTAKPTQKPKASKPKTSQEKPKPKRNRVTCRNCGRVNLVPAGRVFKVCTNCGYTLGKLPK